MNRVPSLTESTLLHHRALDLLAPPDFQKLQIPYAGDSVLEAIKLSPKNTHSNLKNTSWWHSADQYYLLTPIKAVFVSAVTLTISRIGVVYHGLMTPFYYLKYRVSTDLESVERSWQKTKGHFVAFFADGMCAVLGAFLTKVAMECTIAAFHTGTGNWQNLAMSIAAAVLCMGALASAQSARVAPEFFVFPTPDHKVGMYLSLFFRKKLGLVNTDGGLLPFSEKDKIEYQETHQGIKFSGNVDVLWTHIFNAELELIEAVQACNQLLPEKDRIPFTYPLDGDAISRKLEELYAKEDSNAKMSFMSNDQRPILLKADEIRALQLRIKYSKEIFNTARELTYNDGYLMSVLKNYGEQPVKSLRVEPIVSSIPHKTYQDYFNARFFRPSPSSANSSSETDPDEARSENSSSKTDPDEAQRSTAKFSWNSLQINSIHPNTPRPSTGIYAQFSYDVAVNKWKAENNDVNFKTPRELLGLGPNETYSNYKQIKMKYLLACHPDKHQSDPAASEIQACLNAILEVLDEEYKA